MNPKKSKALLVVAALYIVSQVLLFLTVGKDLELILLSLGIFLAIVVSIFAIDFSNLQIGRPIVESVSMRRARQPKEVQERMLREGYKIDEEFLRPKRFTLYDKPSLKPKPAPVTPVEPINGTAEAELSPIEKFEKALLSQAPMFGGLEKLRDTVNSMEETRLLLMLKRMGYKDITVEQVRISIEKLIAKANTPEESTPETNYRPKISLNTADFYDYIKRCMSGNDQESLRQGPPPIMGMEILSQISLSQNGEISPRTLARMRGVRHGGGVKKCQRCQFYDATNSICNAISLPVEPTDVCDNWTANAAYSEFEFRR
ncbi:MAG: hypothetical protein RMI34_12195 [Chloroherpetonaceae bacterium]|nr:hypothetical protein [Chloroherpetonaceae bacterium]MCS7210985.1 hypothetical protein [Chloroherpetonaceae bacterium]MDW8020818.1 hypothetical protein [Chloroherpetonaceae bacterium]MDW8466800.1 hypothetical protein [Chloroherpetonaceae bacterium]